jgi:hypothetical protein
MLISLALGLASSLGLSKPPQCDSGDDTIIDAMRMASIGPTSSKQRTLEERRAYAGCFYLASVYAILPNAIDFFRAYR